jgi:hypothetical protein
MVTIPPQLKIYGWGLQLGKLLLHMFIWELFKKSCEEEPLRHKNSIYKNA